MFKVKYTIDEHKIGDDFWLSKKDLFEAFYGAFYDFIKSHNGEEDLKANNISSKEDFYKFADWNAGGKENCYAIGFAFHKYYLFPVEGGKLEDQPDTQFLGYCYKNGMFLDFLNFLLAFFPYWRNDEGCTCFNPYNHADDFFNSSWAVLVDTSKLFYLDSETVYWWQSFRVKYCLDNIPGTFKSEFKNEEMLDENSELPKLRVSGYLFLGWYDENDNKVEKVTKDITLKAKFKRTDVYTYPSKVEKDIVKVEDPNYKKVDPA